MIWRAHSRAGDDPLWLVVLTFQLNNGLASANRKYRQALRLADATAKSRFRWITPLPIVDIAIEIVKLAGLLGSCGFEDASRRYLSSFSELLKFAAAIAIENKNIDELFYAVTTAGVSRGDPDNPAELWARSIVETWPEESEYRIKAEELFVRSKLRREGVEFEKDIKTNHRQIHQNILTSAGIDPTAGSWPALNNLAIKDQDPTRVLKYCEYKDISRHPLRDRSLDRLALETAKPKIIHCKLHNYKLDVAT